MDPLEVESFCARMPKVELHAHLNGSLSAETLFALYTESGQVKTDETKNLISSYFTSHSLEDCFKIFDIAHAVTVSPAAVSKGTKDVISEFAADGVIYLELRTTPRAVVGSMSKKQYIQAVVDSIKDVPNFIGPDKSIIVKVLVSVNRREGRNEAEDTISKAIEAHITYPDIVVGLDLSGNPKSGNVIEDILPLFTLAQASGLKLALHCAEVPNVNEVEAIIRFRADRLGHGTCIHPNYGGTDELWNSLLQSKTPVEVCLTSNVRCQTVGSYDSHHLQYLLSHGHPFAISTDDKGVFSTKLSKEFEIAARTFHMSAMDLCNCTEMAINASFASPEEKKQLLHKLLKFKAQEGL